MQDQNRNQVPAADRTLKIPEVRYHPSMQPTSPRTRTSQDQRSRPAAATPLKMQDQNKNQVPAADRTLKIPEVRYHPSISTTTPRTTTRISQTLRTRPAAEPPLQAGPRTPQTGPRTPQTGSGTAQTGPRTPQTGPGTPQTGSGTAQTGPGTPQTGSRNPETGPRTPQTGSGTPQTGPRTPQTGSGTAQTGSGTPQTGSGNPQTGPRTPQTGSGNPQVNPAVRPGPDAGKQSAESPVRGDAPSPEQVPPGLGVRVDRQEVEEVEVLTRGQSTNPAWFAWRKNRITASIAHSIAHCGFVNGKSQTPPTSYLAAVTGEARSVRTRAMSWGVQMEAEAVHSYQAVKTAALGRSVSVLACGLFLDAQRPWLGASPDGIVTDSRTGQWLLCLEVKCPYKHKDRRVEDACRDDPSFCLKIQDEDGRRPGEVPVYVLKSSHSYFTQVQFQMAVTGLHQADFVVFTLKETAVVPVTFDPELWEETLSKLETFYRDAVLPRLRDGGGASWSPEL